MKLNGCNLVNYLEHNLVNDLVMALACPFGGPWWVLYRNQCVLCSICSFQ